MSSFDCNNQKLQQVLQLFLQPDYNIVTNTYLDLLLTHIDTEIKNDNQIICKTINDWLSIAFNTWNENSKPCENVMIFTIKLIGTISRREVFFKSLEQNAVQEKACLLFEFTNNNLKASVKMAFVTMLLNFAEHSTGQQWIEKTGAWKEIIKFVQINHTMYVTRESHKFLARYLIQQCNNRPLCTEIILAVTDPLIKATDDSQVDNNINFCKRDLFNQNNLLVTTIELITAILDYTIFYDLHNPIPAMFEELTSLENRVKVVFEVSISTPLMKPVHILSKMLCFCAIRISLQTADSISEEVFDQFTARLCYTSTMLVSKKYILDLVISKKLGIIYWNRLKKLKYIESPKWFKFENQAIAVMILPLSATLKPKYMKEHFLFEDFVEKIFDVTCTAVQRLAYSARDVLLKNDFPMEMVCKSTIDHLLEIVDVIDRETAVIVFQSFCHSLKNFVCESKHSRENEKSVDSTDMLNPMNSPTNSHKKKQPFKSFLDGDPINDKKFLLAALLNGLNVFTEKFKLKWQECVETICMLSIAQDILNHPGVDSKICTLALKTCKLAIQNFMPPNLALLVDFDDHKNSKEIGSTLFRRIHDTHWEVQDSVLEVLTTMTCLSENKYPPYQSLLLDNKFLQVAMEIVKGDNEIYVRASALMFISTAVRINTLWDKFLCQSNLGDLAIKIVYNESEAVVRREAVTLIKELYVHRSNSKSVVSAMSQAMTVAAVLDLHWEVKINALEFWRHFIKSHLTDQGMLDGHFPSMTFSKEHRKIVSLDETEIKQRLTKALDELARQRCLGVLLVTLKDDSDVEVSKTSANIISDLRRILLEYKIHEPLPEQPLAKDTPTIDTNYKKRPVINSQNDSNVSKTSENVIENIVDENDANLLASIYRETMKMEGDEMERTGKQMLEYVGKINREEFLRTILGFDLEKYIQERCDWLQNYTTSFNSILEDIILISNNKNVNSMDCY